MSGAMHRPWRLAVVLAAVLLTGCANGYGGSSGPAFSYYDPDYDRSTDPFYCAHDDPLSPYHNPAHRINSANRWNACDGGLR